MQRQIHTAGNDGARAFEPSVGARLISPAPEPLPFGGWKALAVVLAGCVSAYALSGSALDIRLFQGINAWPRVTGGAVWLLLSLLGEGTVLLGLGALLVVRRPRALWPFALGAVCLVLLLLPLKEAFGMPRPLTVLGEDGVLVIGRRLGKNGFPSGHTATAFLGAHIAWSRFRPGGARWLVLVAACSCGLSRIAIGAHWPEDVAAGAGLGWCCAGVGLALASRRRLDCAPRTVAIAAIVLSSASVVLAFLRNNDGFLSVVRDGIGLGSLCVVAFVAWQDLRVRSDGPIG